ncbi:uncharacterized protein ACA1_131620 [Acanthamoeba castellanii str. Neff]|uniref:Uncharacterized protein n=1 Tax=Acanthamoeba castellanii (strain ATCC 30010 / Neff) TaxID=1257118 RepID=L8GMX7_ACACF|nr:uncharacterized protein ACA1_131620 [Acanthamoeba castellanii str. Neff]ELR14169.1 hypothetical protein ACA1_131620 [Acanthamoeba castellanii str. Neff]
MHMAAACAGRNPDNCCLILLIFYTDGFSHQQTWPKSIDTIYMNPNCFSQPGMALALSLIGGKMASVQVLKILLLGLIDKDKLKCWKQHIDIIDFLKQPGFSKVDLRQLTKMVNRWKKDFYSIYRGQVVQESGSRLSGVQPSFELPNLKMINWAEQIWFLRPPWLQSTGLWECKHQDCKMTM